MSRRKQKRGKSSRRVKSEAAQTQDKVTRKESAVASATDGGGGAWARYALPLILALFAYLSFVNLTYAPFWDDEALTAFIARNLLAFGAPMADDGRNLFSFFSGADIADDGTVHYPLLMSYLVAASFSIFGEGEWQARAVAGILSLAAMLLFADAMRREFAPRDSGRDGIGGGTTGGGFSGGMVVLAVAFACLSPMTLGYARNATYNAAILLFHVLMLWSYLRFCEKHRIVFAALLAAAALAAFQTHPLSAAAFAVALGAFHLLFRRHHFNRRAWLIAIIIGAIYAARLVWFYFTDFQTGGYASRSEDFTLAYLTRKLAQHFSALNANGMLFWTVALWFVLHRAAVFVGGGKRVKMRARLCTLYSDRVLHYFALVVIGAVVMAVINPVHSQAPFADVRYFSSFAVFAAPLAAAFVYWVWCKLHAAGSFAAIAGAGVVAVVLLCTNLAAWPGQNHIIKGDAVDWTLPANAVEYHRPYPDPMRAALNYLRDNAAQDDVLFANLVNPIVLVWYLSDKVYVCCRLTRANPPPGIPAENRDYLFRDDVASGEVVPDWALFFGRAPDDDSVQIINDGNDYQLAHEFPGAWLLGASAQRPEPVRHLSFPPAQANAGRTVKFYRVAGE